jgi:hypothetical protein
MNTKSIWLPAIIIAMLAPGLILSGCENGGGSGSARPSGGAVSGHVYVESSFKPITDVIISCGGISDTTHKSGFYQINNIATGSQAITAVNQYYETYNSSVMINPDETTTLDIFLRYDESIK